LGGDENMSKIHNERIDPSGWSDPHISGNFWTDVWNNHTLIRRLNIVTFFILFVLHVFDVWSTILILEHGGIESNPVVLWFMNLLGTYTGLFLIKAYVIFLSGWIVKEYVSSSLVAVSLMMVTTIVANWLLETNLPMLIFIYGE
jgi:hypothetical protein